MVEARASSPALAPSFDLAKIALAGPATTLFLPLSFVPLLSTVRRQFVTGKLRSTSRLHLVVLPSCEVGRAVESCVKLDVSAPSESKSFWAALMACSGAKGRRKLGPTSLRCNDHAIG